MLKIESPEEVMIYHEIDEKELEFVVYFNIRNTEEIITPMCATCGGPLEPWLLMEIGDVVKVVDTTDTTNQSVGEEKILSKDDSHFNDIVANANMTFRQQQECPEGLDCTSCITKSDKLADYILFDSEGCIRQ